jgi:hypothetical protein
VNADRIHSGIRDDIVAKKLLEHVPDELVDAAIAYAKSSDTGAPSLAIRVYVTRDRTEVELTVETEFGFEVTSKVLHDGHVAIVGTNFY